jgi:hypothetical protein
MVLETENHFNISYPDLHRVGELSVGNTIVKVIYYPLSSDMKDFDIENPNRTGIQMISYVLNTKKKIHVSWGGDLAPDMREMGCGCRIHAYSTYKEMGSAYHKGFDATHSNLWANVIGMPVTSIDFIGDPVNPIGFEINSKAAKVTICLGMPEYEERKPTPSDFDEMLVFDDYRMYQNLQVIHSVKSASPDFPALEPQSSPQEC